MAQASCLCGSVSWEIDGPFVFMHHCHCSRCRKGHGTPFASFVAGPVATMKLKGEDRMERWESSPGFFRTFCRTCGGKTPGAPYQDLQFVPAGNFDGDPGLNVEGHIFVASKASWFDIPDDLPRYDAYPEGFDVPVLDDREPPERAGDGIRGSCACRAVTFRITEVPKRAHNCHCSRCRKGRSAPYACNLFVSAGGVAFSSGRENVVSYKLPDADRFTQAFCVTCGSPMPVTYAERNATVVPMGALDDDPGVRPQAHIFAGSKAPWFEIRDGLPQFETYPK